MKEIQFIRREYGKRALLETEMPAEPFTMFESWLKEALEENILDCTAMVLATADENGNPDARVVLLKDFDEHGFVFFTQYTSPKAIQAESRGKVSLNFYWRELSRQVRIKGRIERVSREESEAYFATRPRMSRISSLSTHQSAVIGSREELEKHVKELTDKYEDKEIPCPEYWGGYRVMPYEMEFFQGRDSRLSDRIRYRCVDNKWVIERLSP